MLSFFTKSLFGSANTRIVAKHTKTVQRVNQLEATIKALSDEALQAKTQEFKQKLASGKTLNDILPEAFAVVREASRRVLGMRHFDVQLVGGMVLHDGKITEMRTGEGKTLVATLPIYLNALAEKGVHLVTINDYLAKRDSEEMGVLYRFLGLSVGCIVHGQSDDQKQHMYHCDITYGTNHEFGFDYLRDNMKFRLNDRVMRPFNYAIVDEADSILIDEARTPLIISGAAEDSSALYMAIDQFIPLLEAADFEKDEKQRSVTLTESGVEKLEKRLFDHNIIKGNGLYDIQNISIVHHVNAALKAHQLFSRDVDYIVKEGKIVIIDEFTGRMMSGRRYSDGLHQALEAKEGVKVEMENQTLASITYQNFFRLYPKLAGMTGTAMTEAAEFEEIYNLHPVEIPTNVPIARKDHDDEIYLTANEKYDAMINQVKECHKKGQPVLVGTTNIDKSEFIANILKKAKIPHSVLNARYHEHEAIIVADAGRLGSVTIATNMAGRGTDIKLGGNAEMRIAHELAAVEDGPEKDAMIAKIRAEVLSDQEKVKEAGGLFVIGTERHESRRIDNQLRGRAGRQGDPGESRFYISLEDDLMRIFGSQKLDVMLRKFGAVEGEAISHKWINNALERAQQKVEARNFDVRKHLLRYDDVMNDQRKIIYEQRRELMEATDISPTIFSMREDVIHECIDAHIPSDTLREQWDYKGLHAQISHLFGLHIDLATWADANNATALDVKKYILQESLNVMQKKEEIYGADTLRHSEKTVVLRILDGAWKDHLLSLDQLRQGINLRAYAQGNPLNEYKREAYTLFQFMMERIKSEVISTLSHFEMQLPQGISIEDLFNNALPAMHEIDDNIQESDANPSLSELMATHEFIGNDLVDTSSWATTPRNSPCPCGSGAKYKHCHGVIKG